MVYGAELRKTVRRIDVGGEGSLLTGKLYCADLSLLIKKVYEDNSMGKVPDRRYEMLSSDYEKEQQEFEISMKEIREKLAQFEDDTDRTEEFLSLVYKYTDIQELTPAIVNEFVDRVLVHKIEEMAEEEKERKRVVRRYVI